jgi:plastocyanin
MRRRPFPFAAMIVALVVLALGSTACHTGTSEADLRQMATCAPAGTALKIEAQNLHFDRDCLAAPAGEAFTLTLDNEENGIPHNVSIYENGQQAKVLFKGDQVTGVQSTVYQVPGLPAGTYYYQCDIHPDMAGALVVR